MSTTETDARQLDRERMVDFSCAKGWAPMFWMVAAQDGMLDPVVVLVPVADMDRVPLEYPDDCRNGMAERMQTAAGLPRFVVGVVPADELPPALVPVEDVAEMLEQPGVHVAVLDAHGAYLAACTPAGMRGGAA